VQVIGADDIPVITVTISIGAALILSLLGVWLKYRNGKKGD
jgi:hypothetical protein